jgi:integrase
VWLWFVSPHRLSGPRRRARVQLQAINERIVKGTFNFAEEFPDYPFLAEIGAVSARRTCSVVFDAFMSHAESRLAQNDLTFATVESYRKILDSVWRPAIGKDVFEGVKYSTLIQIVDRKRYTSRKTRNNVVSALRCAFEFGYRDHPELRVPADDGHDSGMMADSIPEAWRTVFRRQAGQF